MSQQHDQAATGQQNPVGRETNGLAIASLVLGVVWIAWIGSLLAIVFGHVALSQIRKDPSQEGKGLAIAGLVLGYIGGATLIIYALILLISLDVFSGGPERDSETGERVEPTEVNVFDLRVGDCLDGFTDDAEISTVRAVPCSEEHTDEVMAAIDLSAEDQFPGAEAVQERAEEACYEEFERFVGMPWDESQLDFGYLAPTEESWADGDREILCTVGDPNRAVTGTLRDADR